MSVASFRNLALTGLMFAAILPAKAPAAVVNLPDTLQLGSDRIGQSCTATRDWSRSSGTVKAAADQPFVVTCRGVSAAKIVAFVAYERTAVRLDQRECGAASNLTIEPFGLVSARLCQDASLGFQVVEFRADTIAGKLIGASSVQALVPMLRLMRQISTGTAVGDDNAWSPVVDVSGLAAAPERRGNVNRLADLNLESALQQGIIAIRSGEMITASRLLNDALSRVNANTARSTVAELQLAAALADSGLGQFSSAARGFAAAEVTMAANNDIERGAYLERALRTYRALDAINQRSWSQALTELQSLAQLTTVRSNKNPLSDPITLSSLNRDSSKSKTSFVSFKDKNLYNALVLDVQGHLAQSVALLGLGRVADSRNALFAPNGAIASFRQLDQVAQPGSVNWLRARVQMQIARVEARGDRRDAALAAYDCALATTQGKSAPLNDCPIGLNERGNFGSFASASSTIAALQIERAAFASQSGVGSNDVAQQYREAIDMLIAEGRSATVQPPALIGYFEFLLDQTKSKPGPAQQEEFFRVMQVVSDPAIAGDMIRLESVIAADGTIAEDLRTRIELERQITSLRYRILALSPEMEQQRAELERQRAEAVQEKDRIEASLQADSRFRSQDDSPITLNELRQNLREGEVYLKVAKIRTRLFAMAVTRDQAWTYGIDAPASSIESFARRIVDSSRSKQQEDGKRRLSAFDVETSYALFKALAGPAANAIASAKSVVFDPAGQLRNMPAGVLVINADSVKRYKGGGSGGLYDYSKVNFLASQAEISTAISSRSFTVVRSKVAPSTAPRALLGLGENAPAQTPTSEQANRTVLNGSGCSVNLGTWTNIVNGIPPIRAKQLELIAQALGVPGAPTMTGAAFSDVGVQAASDSGELSQYQVLHFATHGSPQSSGEINGCKVDIPPALVATMAPSSGEGPLLSNGLLSYDKIARLKLNANLVVLAACETSSGAEEIAGRLAGQEETSQAALDGLVRAFISANARAVIATYWRVPATSQADELMETLYGRGRTGTIGEALKAAQSQMIQNPKYSHPYYWGAYFVVGDSAKTMLSGGAAKAAE